MTKYLSLALALLCSFAFGQGKMNIFNYTAYNLSNSLVGSNQTANCVPSFNGTNHPIPVVPNVPAGTAVTYDGYYLSGLQNPPINTWTIYTAGGGVTTQNHNSPILNTGYATTTTWQLNKFSLDYVTGGGVPYGGGTVGRIACNTPVTDYAGGAPWAYDAFWFVSAGETFFIIQ